MPWAACGDPETRDRELETLVNYLRAASDAFERSIDRMRDRR